MRLKLVLSEPWVYECWQNKMTTKSYYRALVQARIKLPGAWWLSENVENIVLLRVLRENGLWFALWAPNERVAERVA